MKRMRDITCERCGCTESRFELGAEYDPTSHICPDGETSTQLTIKERIVLGPGERLQDRDSTGAG